MPLHDIQVAFATALTDAAAPIPPGVTAPDGRSDVRRFAIYRNNVMVSLTEALAARFPVCVQIVGTEFFQAMARTYAAACKPSSPLLMAYGGGFPDFIASFPPAAALPYLTDVARLEVAYGEAYHAAEACPMHAAGLGALGPDGLGRLSLRLHPSLRLVRSAYPVASIWQAHQEADPVAPEDWGGEDVLVLRPDADVLVHRLPAGGLVFLEALQAGETVRAAAGAACGEAPGFDLGAMLVGLFAMGAVIAAAPSPTP